MSENEVFYGTYKKLDTAIPDGLDLYDFEEANNLGHLVEVDDQIYECVSTKEVDAYGFSLVIPPSEESHIMCLWYNGGAGVHEVLEHAIRNSLKEEPPQ